MRFRNAIVFTIMLALSVSAALAATAVKVPAEVAGPTGTDVSVRLQADTGGASLTSADLRFNYDDSKLQLLGVYKTGFTGPLTLSWANEADAGFDSVHVELSGGSVGSPAGYHEVAWAVFRVLATVPPAASSTLVWNTGTTVLNGSAPDSFFDGSVSASGANVGFSMSDVENGAPDPSSTANRTVDIVVAPPAGLLSFDMTVEFNPDLLEATGVTKGTATAGWELTANTATSGRVLISLFSSTALTGTDPVTVAKVQFHVKSGAAGATPLAITRYVTNDAKTTYRDDGKFTISADADNDGYTVADGDCDDGRPTVYPGATELCDGLDNNCDTVIVATEIDDDGDHYVECTPWVGAGGTFGGDCNDAVALINPGMIEVCDALNIDENCNLVADDADAGATGQTPWYADADTDTYGNALVSQSKCDQPSGYVANNTDCNDLISAIYPGAPERCNGIDDSCDAAVPLNEIDNDLDTYVECSPWSGAGGTFAGDCNDANAAVNPGVAEICSNLVDDDCDTFVDNVTGMRYVATTGANGTNACVNSGSPCLTIQHAINVACPTETVEVAAGTFTENLRVPKALSVHGAGEGSTIVIPANSLPNPCAGSSLCGSATTATNLFLVEASNVTVSNLTLDGDNTALGSGIDARNGIVENYYAGVFNNTTVHNVTVKNVYLRGIYMSSGGDGFNVHHNTVQNVQTEASSIAIFNFGGSGTFADNTVDDANDAIAANWSRGTSFLRNVITDSGSGVHTDNNGGLGGGADLIQGNQVTNSSYGLWVFVPYLPVTVRGNTATNCDVGLTAAGGNPAPAEVLFDSNTVDAQGRLNATGFYLTTSEFGWGDGNVKARLVNNVFKNNVDGLWAEETGGKAAVLTGVKNVFESNTGTGLTVTAGSITLSGVQADTNNIRNNGTGVLVSGGTVVLDGSRIYGNTAAGVTNTTLTDASATCVWWGDGTGPAPTGSGNSVTAHVTYAPFNKVDDLGYDPDGDLYTSCLGDCDVADGTTYPGALQLCDGINNDCSDSAWPTMPANEANADLDAYRICAGDCDDTRADVYPGANEMCDTTDNDCDGVLNSGAASLNCKEAPTDNICTVNACSVAGACYFSGFTCTVSGNLYYYRDSGDPDGVEDSSTKGMPGIGVAMTGDATGSGTTGNPDGDYSLSAGANVTVAPQAKLGMRIKPDDPGTPGTETYQDGISSLDATRIAQYAVGLRLLTPNQQLAGDTSDNGRVTSFDASLVAQYMVSLITRFPVSLNKSSDWAYLPASRNVGVVGGDSSDIDFAGLFYGDVTANWGELVPGFAAAADAPVSAEEASAVQRLEFLSAQAQLSPRGEAQTGNRLVLEGRPQGSAPAGALLYVASGPTRLSNGDFSVVLGLQNADGIVAMDLALQHDPAIAEIKSVANVGVASNLVLTQNGRDGAFAVSLFGVTPMQGSGTFLEVTFALKSNHTGLPFSAAAEANEGRIPLAFGPGLIGNEAGQ